MIEEEAGKVGDWREVKVIVRNKSLLMLFCGGPPRTRN
jgi:hypothetical protein